jgi:DNA-binding transcriptional MerR regulator
MKAAALCELVGCSPTTFKQWVKEGLVCTEMRRSGAGNHVIYDDANVIAVAVALRLRSLGLTVSRCKVAFEQLHGELRARSSVEWLSLRIVMSPKSAKLVDARSWGLGEDIGAWVVIDLASLAATFVHPDTDLQLNLPFGLQSTNP